SACAQNQHSGAGNVDALLQRAQHAGNVGVEAVELAVVGAHHGVAGADLGGERVGVVEVLEDLFLIRHGNAHAVNGNLPDALHQVVELFGMQREINGVDVFATERRVHHERREGVLHRIAGDAVNFGG